MKRINYLLYFHSIKKHIKWVVVILFAITQLQSFSQCNNLVWADEFDAPAIDGSKWTHEINGDGGGNGEQQYYTDRPQNSFIQDGKLIIKLIREDYSGKPFTSARLNTRFKDSWQYGRFEVRAKVPGGVGTWPAIWMLPDDQSAGWPAEGEIDIMEHVGYDPGRIHGTVHTAAFNHLAGTQVGASTIVSDYNTTFHTYAIEWTPNEIRWFIDDMQYHSFTNQGGDDKWPFNKDFHFILNVAVGGAWGGVEGIDPNLNTAQMEVEYCRVYSGAFTYGVSGDNKVYENDNNKAYSIEAIAGASYNWSVPAGAQIVSGQGSNSIVVNYGTTSGNVSVNVSVSGCSSNTYSLPVEVEPPVTLEYIFEDFQSNRNLKYVLASGVLTQTIANPNPSSPNTSSLVGRYVRNASELYDVLFTQTNNIGNASEFTSRKRRIQMDVYTSAPVGTKISMQLENSSTSLSTNFPTGRHSVYEAYTTVQNTWETIEFDFLSRPDGTVGAFDCDNIVLLVEPNSSTNYTVFFDNLVSAIAPDKPILSTVVIADYDGINNLDPIFSNGIYNANVVNPAPDAVNGSSHSASYVRDAGSPYDVVSFATTSIGNAAYFKSGDYILFADIYTTAPVGTDITISFENTVISENDYPYGRNSQYTAVTTSTNAWETLMFTFALAPDAGTSNLEVDELSILFKPNSSTGHTYYIDNVRYGTTVAPPTYAYDFTIENYDGTNHLSFVSSTGVYTAPTATPSPNGVNSSPNSAKYVRSAEDLYDVLFLNTDLITDASTYESEENRFALDVYTNAPAGTIISWQLENSAMSVSDYPSGRHSVYQAAVKTPNEWHALEFSYSSSPDKATPDNSIDRMVILTNPNSSTNHTYYFDNFRSLKKGADVVNNPPIANAGSNQILVAGTTTASLNGSVSSDPDGDALTFSWSQLSGPNAVVFSSVTVSNPTLSNLVAGDYIFALTVSDGQYNNTDQVEVKVEDGGNEYTIPGIIQAEDFSAMSGIQTEGTSDVGGGINVGWIDTGDWMDYEVSVSTAGTYNVNFRVAADGTAQKLVQLRKGATTLGTAQFTATSGWQNWTTASTSVDLTAGNQTLRVYASSTGFNLNWIEFEPVEICNPTVLTAYYQINTGSWLSALNPVVNEGDALKCGPQPATGGTWAWSGPNGFAASTREITLSVLQTSDAGNYVATFTNNCGTASTLVYNVTVNPVELTCQKIEAENWANMSGVQTEGTSDIGGGLNVGWINTNDWLDYNIYVSSPGTYTLKLRAATPNGPDVCLVQVDYVDAAQVNIANTGSWQTWQTFETTFTINTVGNHAIRLQALTDGFNINWIELCHGGTVNNAPVALFSNSVQSGIAPLAVSFDASASNDADGDALSYSWSFGDGTTASGINVQHTYTSVGNFVAVLTVNDGSLSAQATASITVNAASNDCVVSSANGDFSVEVSADANNPTLTFVPTVQGTGNNLLLLYYGTNPNGPYPGSSPVPKVPFQINAAAEQTVYFYYTYSLATGGENNSSANKNSFVVGQCGSTLKQAEIVASATFEDNLVKVYPNPVTTKLTIELGNLTYEKVSLYNTTGQLVHTETVNQLNNKLEISFDHFEKGVYMVVLTNQDSRKVIRVCK